MKILIYNVDKGGLKTCAEYLFKSMRELGAEVTLSDKLDYKNFDIIHIQMDYSLFHPFGLGIIPKLIRLKLNRKKVVLTIGTVPSKIEIYTRNKLITFAKRICLPVTNNLIYLFSDKIIVMMNKLKLALVEDYRIPSKHVRVIEHGIY